MSLDSVVLLSALVLTGCAGIQVETLDPQLGNDDDAGLIGNPSFDETADAEHRVIVDMLNGPRPSTSFQIARKGGASTLTISPFRLGHNPNIRVGVGLITQAPEALELHEEIAQRLWATSLKGMEAAAHVESLIAKHGIT